MEALAAAPLAPLLDRLPVMVFRRLPDKLGTLLAVSAGVKELTGYAAEELLHNRTLAFGQLLHPDDFPVVQEAIRAAAGKRKPYRVVYRIQAAGGRTKWVKEEGQGLFDDAGNLLALEGFALDLTAERRSAEQLSQAETRQRELIEHLPEGVILVGRDHRITLANQAGRGAIETLNGVEPTGILSRLGLEPLMAFLSRPLDQQPLEITPPGQPVPIYAVWARPLPGGSAAGFVLLLKDITRERQLETESAERDRLATVGQLAAGLAHDFNNLLQAISLNAELLIRHEAAEERLEGRAETILRQAERGARLVRQILDFGRRTVINRTPTDLSRLLGDLTPQLRGLLPEEVGLISPPPGESVFVHADPAQIKQLLTNLTFNARDAMPAGGSLTLKLVRVVVDPESPPPIPDLPPGPYAVLEVQDTGRGMTEEVQRHIFEPFFTTKPPGEGTGLGLSQVFGIVKQHSGFIGVESAPEQGARFRIFLPERHPVPTIEPPPPPPKNTALGKTILVAEDEDDVRGVVQEGLEVLGFRVLPTANGLEAWQLFGSRRGEIDLVLSDVVMPEMGGIELYHRILEVEPEAKIVLMSGFPLGEVSPRAQLDRLAAWVEKPFSFTRLGSLLARVLAP